MSNYELVREFEAALRARGASILLGRDLAQLRLRLIAEEYHEVAAELLDYERGAGDRPALAKELADLLYVVYGTAASYAIPIDAVFLAVHRANMAKVQHGAIIGGKLHKPRDYQPPDIAALLRTLSS